MNIDNIVCSARERNIDLWGTLRGDQLKLLKLLLNFNCCQQFVASDFCLTSKIFSHELRSYELRYSILKDEF